MFRRVKKVQLPNQRTGASTKRETIRRLTRGGGQITIEADRRDGPKENLTMPVTLILSACVILSFMLTERLLMDPHTFRPTGEFALDQILVGPGIPALMGDADLDKMAIIFIRAMVIFIGTGIFPLLSYFYCKIADKMHTNLFIRFWGTTVSVFLVVYGTWDFLVPFLGDLAEQMMQ